MTLKEHKESLASKSSEKTKRPHKPWTKKMADEARAVKEKWLASEAGQKALAELQARNYIATKYALDYETLHTKFTEFENWLSERS